MWVIFDTDTGEEIDTVESAAEMRHMLITLNGNADYDHFDKRWEA